MDEKGTVAFFAKVQMEGKRHIKRNIEYYNLDMIISVGYRVNSKRGTEFRRWATQTLNSYLMKGYALNQKHIAQTSLTEITRALDMIQRGLKNAGEITDIGTNSLDIIQKFAKAWHILLAYDEDRLEIPIDPESPPLLNAEEAEDAIHSLTKELKEKKEATDLFARPRTTGIQGIIGNIHQTFDGSMLLSLCEGTSCSSVLFCY